MADPPRKDLAPRQRWMLYAVYAAAGWTIFTTLIFLLTLSGTREFIGERGVEYCWMYGSFQRYLFTHVALLCVDTVVLLGLYWLARRNFLVVYLIVWVAWLLGEPVLSFFDMSYC